MNVCNALRTSQLYNTPAADGGEGVLPLDELEGLPVLALGGQLQVALNGDMGRAGGLAGGGAGIVAVDTVLIPVVDGPLLRAPFGLVGQLLPGILHGVVPKLLGGFEEKIAIIGAGPAGLSCAYYLAEKGYKPTVFEKNEKPGGMLRYGVPSFKLEKYAGDLPVLNADLFGAPAAVQGDAVRRRVLDLLLGGRQWTSCELWAATRAIPSRGRPWG